MPHEKKIGSLIPREQYNLAWHMLQDIYMLAGIQTAESLKDLPPFQDGYPKCSTPKQYAEWKVMARLHSPGRAGFCRDCTTERQREMITAHRCERPTIAFRLDDDGFEEGYMPREGK